MPQFVPAIGLTTGALGVADTDGGDRTAHTNEVRTVPNESPPHRELGRLDFADIPEV